jgi:hypothetical protein
MRGHNAIAQMPERQVEQDRSVDLLHHEPVLRPLTPIGRLQLAASGLSDVRPEDVTAMLTDVVVNEVAAVKKMAGRVEDMNQLFFSPRSNSAASPGDILTLLERMSALHRQRQSEFLKSAELLHRLASPPIRPTVNVLSVSRA